MWSVSRRNKMGARTLMTPEAEKFLRENYATMTMECLSRALGVTPHTVSVWVMRLKLKSVYGMESKKTSCFERAMGTEVHKRVQEMASKRHAEAKAREAKRLALTTLQAQFVRLLTRLERSPAPLDHKVTALYTLRQQLDDTLHTIQQDT